MGGHPCPFCLPADDEAAQILSVRAGQRGTQPGLFEEDGVGGVSKNTPIGQAPSDLDGAVTEESTGLVVEPDDVVLSHPVGAPGMRQGAF